MDKTSILVSICCSLIITGATAFMVHNNLTEDINLIGRSAQARTARLERDTEESLSRYQRGIEDNYLNIFTIFSKSDATVSTLQFSPGSIQPSFLFDTKAKVSAKAFSSASLLTVLDKRFKSFFDKPGTSKPNLFHK